MPQRLIVLFCLSAIAWAGDLPVVVLQKENRYPNRAEIRKSIWPWASPYVAYDFDYEQKPRKTFSLTKETQRQIATLNALDPSQLFPVPRANGGSSFGPVVRIALSPNGKAVDVGAVIRVEKLGPKYLEDRSRQPLLFTPDDWVIPLAALPTPLSLSELFEKRLTAFLGGDAEYPIYLVDTFLEKSESSRLGDQRRMARVVAESQVSTVLASSAPEADVPVIVLPLGALTEVKAASFNELRGIGPETFDDMHTPENLGQTTVRSVTVGSTPKELVASLRARATSCTISVAQGL